jgi:hypothetical protein
VNDVTGLQASRPGRDGLADLDGAERYGLLLDHLPAGTLDRAGNARSHPQSIVRRIRNCVHLQQRDVALEYLETDHVGDLSA